MRIASISLRRFSCYNCDVMLHTLVVLLAVASLAPGTALAEGGAKHFAYVSPQLVITAEVSGPHSFVVNFIDLSDFVMVVLPGEFIYKGSSGKFYIGQVFDKESRDNRGQVYRYSASTMLKSRSYAGLTILGDFQELDSIEELSMRIGAKRYYLQPLSREDFEVLAAKVGELDLTGESPQEALEAAGLSALGAVKSTDGTSEWDRDWQGMVRSDGVILPKIVEKPAVAPTEEAVRNRTYGRVRLSAIITRNGGVEDLRVEKGLGHGLDERALEAVKNSWVFLPATKNGEVLEGRLEFYVDFLPPAAPKSDKPAGAQSPRAWHSRARLLSPGGGASGQNGNPLSALISFR
jgi:TonB family protein